MAPRRKGEARQRHGTRQLVQKVFAEAGASASLSTSAISERVSKAAGSKIPDLSVYSALRTLVRGKELKVGRDGHEKVYSIASPRGRPPKVPAPSSPVRSEEPEFVPTAKTSESIHSSTPGPTLPHHLAVGQSLILHVGEEHVEAVTNVHGKLVVERHPRDRAGTR